ncbi:MAG: AarF/ABC1/UbiB kinase family protein [Candidatus Woesearchaeota archaeon]|jgi:ubiquinone biosynthesis protein|nr:AarF/ABC1/UbiB kinase family protein [Candidatus Woesearchaeota archaeon]MDP6265988.1 AarF/ABC1/UbiB kinase family protein [Candidatus Woesearchaeota archaeon]MDP7322551.1 AarF/ABC1/UbiB kinase family protein [Candidatus Woesearchaeota archaeon]
MFKLIKEVRDLNRFREILTVLFEEGFDFLIAKIKLKHKVPVTKRVKARIEKKKTFSIEKRLRLTLERLGPTFIKFGQVLSVRPDLIPKSYTKELEKLQDKVPQFSYAVAKQQIKKELGKDINEIFTKFEKKPIACASISQVHKATLKNNKKVAVKIQRPNVREIMETDVEIMFYVAKLLEKHMPKIRKFNPTTIIEEFSKWTEKELDFKREAINAKRFARNFSRDNTVKIPEIYDEFTTNRILVMDFIDGTELHNIKQIKSKKINLTPLIEHGFNAVLTQVFVHGFFHADPHPGNIIITNDKKIAFVDFGIVGHFDENLKAKSIDLFYGVIERDAEKIADTLIDLSDSHIEDKEELKYEISDILESMQESNIIHTKVSRVLEEIMDTSLSYGLKIPMPFVLFGKTVITLEGVALEYDPKFNLVGTSKPFVEKLIAKRYNPVYQFNNFMKSMLRFKKFTEEFPDKTSKALERIEKGTIKVDIEDTDIKKLSLEIDKSGNRVAYSMLIAALLIVAALTINFGAPIIFNMPLIPLLSFSLAMILSWVLLVSILKEKNIIK